MLKVLPQSLLAPLSDFNLLDEDHPPLKWCSDWVSRRWVEGLQTLRLIPLKGPPRGFGNAWPTYAYEWQDLIAQQQQGELQATQHEQNRVRLQPSYRQVTRCEAVVSWPLGLRMRARRDVRGVPAWRMRRDASSALHQRLRPGFRQATRRTSAGILAPHDGAFRRS